MYILFELKKSKLNKIGKAPIWCRITIQGQRASFSTGIFAEPDKWFAKGQNIKGASEAVRVANMRLNQIRTDIETLHLDLTKQRKLITPESIKQIYLGENEIQYTVLEAFDKYLEVLNAQKNAGILSKDTVWTWQNKRKILAEYLAKIKKTQLLLIEVKDYFAEDYKIYLLTEKGYSNDYTVRTCGALKAVFEYSIKREWLTKNPMASFEMKKSPEKSPDYLSFEQLNELATYNFKSALHRKTRDFFVFCSYSGLSYADYENLVKDTLVKIEKYKDKYWLVGNRQKGDSQGYGEFELKLRKECLAIIEQYGEVSKLPLYDNQLFNRLLKEIGATMGWSKHLHCHLARKTFVHLCLNEWGLTDNVIAAMMGWRDTRMLKLYGKVRRDRIDGDTQDW